MQLPGSRGSPDEAANHRVNVAAVIRPTWFSLAAAPSSPGTVMEQLDSRIDTGAMEEYWVRCSSQGKKPGGVKTDAKRKNPIGTKRRGLEGLDPGEVRRGKSNQGRG